MTTLKTIKDVLEGVEDYKKPVIRAVIKTIGKESIEDVINHGADSGFSGFIYHKETCAFYAKYRQQINQWIKDYAKELDEEAVSMVVNFNCLKSEEYREDVGACLYNGKLGDNTTQVENALAWFVLEETCRLFEQ